MEIKTHKVYSKMTNDEMIEVIQAQKEGKQIQVKSSDGFLIDILDNKPSWNFSEFEYRIKPKQEYIPFTFEDDLVGKVVIHRDAKLKGIILMQEIDIVQVSDKTYSYSQLKQFYTFLDNTPCGKLI